MRWALYTSRSKIGIGQGRLLQPGMPVGDRRLAGHERGTGLHSVVQQLQQIVALGCRDGADGEVVNQQQIKLGKLRQAARKASFRVGDPELLKKPRRARVEHAYRTQGQTCRYK